MTFFKFNMISKLLNTYKKKSKKKSKKKKTKNSKKSKKKKTKNNKKNTNFFKIFDMKVFSISISITSIMMLLSFQFFFSIGYMDGYSMTPNIHNNDILFIDKHASIKRFDLIYFRNPNRPNEYLVRRVIGLPTDKIKYKDDELYVNNVNLNEPYLNTKKKMMEPMILTEDFSLQEVVGKDEVPNDYYFVLGDNRNSTVDSRDFGFIPRDSVKGKISSKLSIRN